MPARGGPQIDGQNGLGESDGASPASSRLSHADEVRKGEPDRCLDSETIGYVGFF